MFPITPSALFANLHTLIYYSMYIEIMCDYFAHSTDVDGESPRVLVCAQPFFSRRTGHDALLNSNTKRYLQNNIKTQIQTLSKTTMRSCIFHSVIIKVEPRKSLIFVVVHSYRICHYNTPSA